MRESQGLITAGDPVAKKAAKKLYIESYGCQMNFSDGEVVAAILGEVGYRSTSQSDEADLVLLNTCSIREKAEQSIRKRLAHYHAVK